MDHSLDNYVTADFLLSDDFVSHQLEPTPETAQLWEAWLAGNPPNLAEWNRAVYLLESIRQGLSQYAEHVISDEAIEALLARIRETNHRQHTPVRRIGYSRWVAAAVLLILSGLFAYSWLGTQGAKSYYTTRVAEVRGAYTERVNQSNAVETIVLPDSSVVKLAPGSRISFQPSFHAAAREVYLSGEADFQVTRDVRKPFLVYANEVVTRVLGTQFTVRAFDAEARVLVNVSSGQVSVSKDDGVVEKGKSKSARGLLLLPNQQAVFSRQAEEFSKSIVPEPKVIGTARQMPLFEYDAVPVSEVIRDLEGAYGISILYNKEQLKNCELSASLKTETFEEKLRVICTTINADYQKLDGQVVIHGGECR
ncbi:FecR family protein [Dyadobacter jiangsuensis]|uniref:FecR family protein n=1 Tax=Dyadobacter jiangsuensis TaxID=1591085 RepID=A0A2P8GC17_9BACT|nr:FecR family protein [Dyadobacter jiangsuensis]PSL31487.1 FecR family protein [Dyadobacter jiangsuensis]